MISYFFPDIVCVFHECGPFVQTDSEVFYFRGFFKWCSICRQGRGRPACGNLFVKKFFYMWKYHITLSKCLCVYVVDMNSLLNVMIEVSFAYSTSSVLLRLGMSFIKRLEKGGGVTACITFFSLF